MGRNLADALGKLGARPILISAVGNDQTGDYLLKSTLNHIVSMTAVRHIAESLSETGQTLHERALRMSTELSAALTDLFS